MVVGSCNVDLTVVSVKTFTRRSGTTGQELNVISGSQYPAVIDCPDKEILDLSNLKPNDVIKANVELGFKSLQCVSDSDKKYYKRLASWRILDIL